MVWGFYNHCQENEWTGALHFHYDDVIMTTKASQSTSLTSIYSTVYSDADQRKHQSSASLAFVWEFTGTGEFPAQRANYAENVSIWWRHHVFVVMDLLSENDYGIQCLKARYLQGKSLMDILYPLLTWMKFNSAYISNHTPSPVWYAIMHPFQTAPLTFGMDK